MEFWILYNSYGTKIYNYFLWFLGNCEDAEDLTHTVFLKAREQFDSLRNPDKAQRWLWAIARNTAKNFYRDRRKALQREQIPIDITQFSENGHRNVRLMIALSKLTTKDRDILILREFHSFSYAELAEMLDNTISGIKSRLFRARENLRKQYFSLEV